MEGKLCQPEGHQKPNAASCQILPISPKTPVVILRMKKKSNHTTPNSYRNQSHFGMTPVIPIEILKARLSEDCFYTGNSKKSQLKPEKVDKSNIIKSEGPGTDVTSDSTKSENYTSSSDSKSDDDEFQTFVIFRSSAQDLARAKEAIASGRAMRMPEPDEPVPSSIFTTATELTPAELEHLEERSNPKLPTRPVIRQNENEYKRNQAEFRERERQRKLKRAQNKSKMLNTSG